MSANRHWNALDDTFSRLLPSSGLRHTRERFAHRAAALSDIYLARLLKTIAAPALDRSQVSRRIDELQRTHRALTATLTHAWTEGAERGSDHAPRTDEAP